jgi:hypothetical protein
MDLYLSLSLSLSLCVCVCVCVCVSNWWPALKIVGDIALQLLADLKNPKILDLNLWSLEAFNKYPFVKIFLFY